ncbi:MAG: GTPase domain-containing protein [Quisquiliibacterium sp.]
MSAKIQLSLVSHTNAGKTTLARTLLGRDIGQVRDEAHVTMQADRHLLAHTEQGDELWLWDTPGFGDSRRIARRLAASDNPIGWFLTQVWDRYRNRAFYASQQAVRNVQEHSDLVLYLVNASENPHDASYLEPEMQLLEWVGKPVIIGVNAYIRKG